MHHCKEKRNISNPLAQGSIPCIQAPGDRREVHSKDSICGKEGGALSDPEQRSTGMLHQDWKACRKEVS